MHFAATTGSGSRSIFDSGDGADRARSDRGAAGGPRRVLGDGRRLDRWPRSARRSTRYEIHVRGDQRDEYPQVFTRIDVVHEVEGPASRARRHPPLDRAVGDEVLPGQRDAVRRRTEIHHRYRVVRGGDQPLDERPR